MLRFKFRISDIMNGGIRYDVTNLLDIREVIDCKWYHFDLITYNANLFKVGDIVFARNEFYKIVKIASSDTFDLVNLNNLKAKPLRLDRDTVEYKIICSTDTKIGVQPIPEVALNWILNQVNMHGMNKDLIIQNNMMGWFVRDDV